MIGKVGVVCVTHHFYFHHKVDFSFVDVSFIITLRPFVYFKSSSFKISADHSGIIYKCRQICPHLDCSYS